MNKPGQLMRSSGCTASARGGWEVWHRPRLHVCRCWCLLAWQTLHSHAHHGKHVVRHLPVHVLVQPPRPGPEAVVATLHKACVQHTSTVSA